MASPREVHVTHRNHFDELGCEVLRQIFSSLPPITLAYCSSVCSSWHEIITSSTGLWRSAYCSYHRRLRTLKFETEENEKEDQAKEAGDADFRTRYVDEEQKARLANGRVSTLSLRAHSGRVNCCRMVMGQVVSGSSDGTIKMWCAGKTGQLRCGVTYKVPEKPLPVVQVEFDGNKVIGAAGKDLFVWSRVGNRRLLKRIGGQYEICSICAVDSDLAMGCADGTVRLFDLYSGRCTQIFRKHTEPVKGVVMDMATQSMASGSSDGTVKLFDARSGQKIVSLLRPSSMTGISCLHASPLGHKLFAGSVGGFLYCFDLRNHQTVWNVRVGSPLTCMDSPGYSSSAIGVGGVDGAIKVFEVDSGKRVATFHLKKPRLPSSPVLGMALGMTRLISCHADWNLVHWQFSESNCDLEGDQLDRIVVKTLP